MGKRKVDDASFPILLITYLKNRTAVADRTQTAICKNLKISQFKFYKYMNQLIGEGRVKTEKLATATVYTLV